MKTFLKNLEHCFLIESTKIETVSFPYKIALSEATVKIIEWGVQSGLATKNGILSVTTLFFENCVLV